ncbi:hypothetical protein F9K33_12155 [bacterium]|nr:MAG: hypothetical protein F9K33_12155 [bacterium]
MKRTLLIILSSAIIFFACSSDDSRDGTVIDIDGNVYRTITIGTQVWMVENLNVTRYRNGDSISKVTDDMEWATMATGGYCNYDNNDTNASTYGHLYNWYAVNSGNNIAPAGWHVASDSEWDILTTCLGGDSIAAGKLKEVGLEHWASPNTGATNATGFTALPAGARLNSGTFYHIGDRGIWWSATEYDAAYARYRSMYYDLTLVYKHNYVKTGGFSVRCVRD